jgi:hypothetical protein
MAGSNARWLVLRNRAEPAATLASPDARAGQGFRLPGPQPGGRARRHLEADAMHSLSPATRTSGRGRRPEGLRWPRRQSKARHSRSSRTSGARRRLHLSGNSLTRKNSRPDVRTSGRLAIRTSGCRYRVSSLRAPPSGPPGDQTSGSQLQPYPPVPASMWPARIRRRSASLRISSGFRSESWDTPRTFLKRTAHRGVKFAWPWRVNHGKYRTTRTRRSPANGARKAMEGTGRHAMQAAGSR